MVKSLRVRVVDWKGHHLENFGDLLLDDVLFVTKSDIDREYHVFLFEKIIIFCKVAVAQLSKGAKEPKQKASLLNRQVDRDSPLLLKGRIFLNTVTQVIPDPSKWPYPSKPVILTRYCQNVALRQTIRLTIRRILSHYGGKATSIWNSSSCDAEERIRCDNGK